MQNINTVLFHYEGESKKFLSYNLGLSEETITSKLNECFLQTKIVIKEILVTFDYHQTKGENAFSCGISLVSDDADFNITESGTDSSAIVHLVVDKTIEYVRKLKDKRV